MTLPVFIRNREKDVLALLYTNTKSVLYVTPRLLTSLLTYQSRVFRMFYLCVLTSRSSLFKGRKFVFCVLFGTRDR